MSTPLLAFRALRIMLHLMGGMATCGLIFPSLSNDRRKRYIRRWSGQLLGMCAVSVEQGAGGPALEHALVVANHVSWLDIFVINALYPCRFVAKSEIRDWPLLGWLAEKAGTVFIARGKRRDLRHIFKGLVARLEHGERVAFFPEGKTAVQGHLQIFHANLFEAAIDAQVPVQAYALRYLDAAGAPHPSVEYVGEMSVVQSLVAILSGSRIHAQLMCTAPIEASGAHRRELASAAHDAVAAALGIGAIGAE